MGKEKPSKLKRMDLCGFVFKSRSHSSGMRGVKLYSPEGVLKVRSIGIFAGAFMKRFPLLPVEDEERLQDPALRENFVERVFAFRTMAGICSGGKLLGRLGLVPHQKKLLTLACSPKHYTTLGKLVAEAKKYRREALHERDITTLKERLWLIAMANKNTNVLQQITGYLKKQLSSDGKAGTAGCYRKLSQGTAADRSPHPSTAPCEGIQCGISQEVVLLNPHPLELMLRSHI